MYTILVCDNTAATVERVKGILEKERYRVLCAKNGQEAIRILQTQEVHLLLIDVMMPTVNGFEAVPRIRKFSNLPIIFLSVRSSEEEIIHGLKIGADDYIVKPFETRLLLAKVASHLRRYMKLGAYENSKNNKVYRIGELKLTEHSRTVMLGDKMIQITPTEYGILRYLMKNEGRVLSAVEIYEEIWKEEARGAENAIAVHIRHIREKIEKNPAKPQYLKRVWGAGYKIEKPGLSS